MFVRLASITCFLFSYDPKMASIDLKTFLEGYKKAEITLNDKKRVFREPSLRDMGLSIEEILKKYCLE